MKLRTRLDIREEGCSSLYSGPYRRSLCPESTASVEGSWRKLRAHWADALAYAGERSDPHSNSNFLSGEGPRTLSPRWSGRWGSGIKVASGKTEDKDSRIKLEMK